MSLISSVIEIYRCAYVYVCVCVIDRCRCMLHNMYMLDGNHQQHNVPVQAM